MISFSASITNAFFKTGTGVNKPANTSANFFKRTFSILTRQEKKRFAFLAFADIFISVIDILSLALLLWIIRFYVQPGQGNAFSSLPVWMQDKNSVSLIALFFFVFSVKNLLAFFVARSQYKFMGNVAVRISKNALQNYQQGEFEQFVNVDSSIHIRKIAHQPIEFSQYILAGFQQIFTQSFLILIAIIAVMLFNAKLFFLLLVVLIPPVVAVFYIIKKRLAHYKSQIWSSNDKSHQYLMDALKGYVEGNVYNRNRFFLDRFLNYRQKFSSYHFNSISLQTLPARIIEVFAILGLFILIAIAKWTGDSGSATFLTIGAFMAAAYKIIPGIVKIINTAGQIKAYELAINGLDQNCVLEETVATQPADRIRLMEFRDVSFEYGNLSILKNFSFRVEKGDFIGITGKSGRGKTTILNLLLGFLSPSDGQLLINDTAVNKESIKGFRPFISYMRQQVFLVHDSIRSNITLEEETSDEKNLQMAIQISGIDNIVNGSSEGMDKLITENGKNISGGQQQRIALARAVYNHADLILLDEPFNELDEVSEQSLLNHFKQLANAGRMIILITHNKRSLAYCNKIISLDGPAS